MLFNNNYEVEIFINRRFLLKKKREEFVITACWLQGIVNTHCALSAGCPNSIIARTFKIIVIIKF
jgi:hypothetical protein